MMETEIKEERILVLKRVPPGDNWMFINGTLTDVFPTLTDALEAWYQKTGDTQFYIDARKGTVDVIKTEEVVKSVRKYSLYGEDA